jgi:hypothetical protein
MMWCTNPECPDLLETGSPGEYRPGVECCPACGAPLQEAPPEEQGPTQKRGRVQVRDNSPPVSVFSSSDPAEVEIVKSILQGAEIPFVLEGMESFSAFRAGHAAHRFNPRGGEVVFVVPAERVEEARALLTIQEDGPTE